MRAIPLHAIPVLKRTDVDFKAWIHPEEANRLVAPAEIESTLFDYMHEQADGIGLQLPWEKCSRLVRFQPRRVTAWTGITGHGKTTLLKQVMQHGMKTGERVLIASFEEDPPEVLAGMVQMAAHTERPSREFVRAWSQWANDRLVIYDRQSKIKPDMVVGVANYCAAKFGTTHVVIDSLMRLDLRGDDYDGQNELFNLLSASAKANNTHFHVVCHARKGNDESPLTIMDLKGSGDIINQADKIVQVWRNKAKQVAADPSGLMIVHKTRGKPKWLGEIGLWYHDESSQFLAGSDHLPMSLFSMHNDGIPQSVPW